MFRIMGKDGVPTGTVYQHRSEAETYWHASVGKGPARFDENVRDNEITVFDADNNEVGAISRPRA